MAFPVRSKVTLDVDSRAFMDLSKLDLSRTLVTLKSQLWHATVLRALAKQNQTGKQGKEYNP